MKKQLLAATAALLFAGATQAGVMRFNNPGLIDIDPSNVAHYTEDGLSVSSQAADFLLLDDGAGNGMLVGGFLGAGPLTLRAANGGLFSLFSLDFGYFDLGDTAGDLMITGLLNGQPVATQTFALGAWTTAQFGSQWMGLTEVSFIATSGFQLDNIAAVPEPASMALLGVGLAVLAVTRRQRPSR